MTEDERVILDVPPRPGDPNEADTEEFEQDPPQERVILDMAERDPEADDDAGAKSDDGDVPTDTEG